MNKWLLSVMMIFCVFGLTGCWDRHEVKDLALVMAKGVDKESDGNVRISVQVAVPSGMGGGSEGGAVESGPGKSFVLSSAVGKNVKDADQHLQQQLPRKIYNAHRRILIIGEDEARSGLKHILDQFGRDPMNRMRDLIIIAKGGTAEEFLDLQTFIEKIPGQEISAIEEQESGSKITMLDFLRNASGEGIVPMASAIEKIGNPSLGEQPFSLQNTAVFKDLKLIGYLNECQTKGVLWVQGKAKRGYITADIPGHGNITLMVTSSKGEIQPIVTPKAIQFKINIRGTGEILENGTNLDLSEDSNFALMKKALDREVLHCIQEAYNQAQEYDADVFGLGQELYRHYPQAWNKIGNRWNDEFQQIQFKPSVNIEPLRAGMSGPSVQLKRDEVQHTS